MMPKLIYGALVAFSTKCLSARRRSKVQILVNYLIISRQNRSLCLQTSTCRKKGTNALIVATQGGHFKVVEMLVEAGALVDYKDDEDGTALLAAIKGSFMDIAHYLVQHGANPDDTFIDDKKKAHNLLMDAIIANNTDFAIALVQSGANLSYVDDDGVNALTQAAYQGYTDVVRELIFKGANVAVANKEGINPLIAACSEGHLDVVTLLLAEEGCDVDARDKDGTNALMAAAVRGHRDVESLLCLKGASIDAQNVDGHTALMFAYNGKNQVETLLDKYSDYIKEDRDNSTAIIKEALQTHMDVISILLKNGADPNLKVCCMLCICLTCNFELTILKKKKKKKKKKGPRRSCCS